MPNRRPLVLLLATVALATAACSGGGSAPSQQPGSPGASPGGTPGASPSGGIEHPTGATDVVLRYDESGGFVPVEFLASHVPYFTLYGDGTVIFQPLDESPPEIRPGQPIVGTPLRTGTLSGEQMQQLLEFALRDGGLAAARLRYDNPMIADAPTAVFTVNAGGVEKTVEIVALGLDAEPGPDSAIKAAMAGLAERLRNFDQNGTLPTSAYEPERYRGLLLEAGPVEGVAWRPWPWEAIDPKEFAAPADPNVLQMHTRELSPAEVAELGIEGIEGGAQSIFVTAPDGTRYSLVVRPLLPDEQA